MTQITSIADINIRTNEGKLLVATLTMLSNESLIPKSYDALIEDANILVSHMYGTQEPKPEIAY